MFKVTNFMFVGTKMIIEFNEGEKYRVFNVLNYFKEKQGPVAAEILDGDNYKKVKIVDSTLEWFNGIDFDPSYLYDQTTELVL